VEANGLDRVIMIIRNRTYPDQRVVCLDGYIHDSPKTVDTPAMVAGLLGVPYQTHADCQKLIDDAVRENGRLKGELAEAKEQYRDEFCARRHEVAALHDRQAPLEAVAEAVRKVGRAWGSNRPTCADALRSLANRMATRKDDYPDTSIAIDTLADRLAALDAPAKGEKCPRCKGRQWVDCTAVCGSAPHQHTCPDCHGTGVKPAEKPDWESLAIAWAKEQWRQSPNEENPAAHALYEEAIAAKAARKAAEKQESAK